MATSYVFDPGFCATSTGKGTGDRWFSGSGAVSSWYELLDTHNTPYNLGDDSLHRLLGDAFMGLKAVRQHMGASIPSGGVRVPAQSTQYGDGRDYHDAWYLLNPATRCPAAPTAPSTGCTRPGPTREPAAIPSSQRNTDGEQSFSLYVAANVAGSSGPRIYGLGAMQMFTPLSASGGSTPVRVLPCPDRGRARRQDDGDPALGPGRHVTPHRQRADPHPDGGRLDADHAALRRADVGTTNVAANSACNSNHSASTDRIVTEATGSQPGEFNGCWLTISVSIPTTTRRYQGGWWKIRYNMTGSGTSNDVTTWKVSIRGNPVHLIVP